MSGAKHRRKGSRVERELVQLHKDSGIWAERVPLSGATRYQGGNHDLDVYCFGRDWPPLTGECKARKSGSGFAVLEKWLGTNDALFLKRNNAAPLILLPWRTWAVLLNKIRGAA
jgi:Holliday junction resolvase